MKINPINQAILLLTVSLGKAGKSVPKPLSSIEWEDLSQWLLKANLDPSVLMKIGWQENLAEKNFEEQHISRLEGLLKRGFALGVSLEKWQRTGLWFITRSDQDYPSLLNSRLTKEAPPVLFGIGDKKLLNQKDVVAVVGSRIAHPDDLDYAEKLGVDYALKGSTVVSGGAPGVDQQAVFGSLNNQGAAIVVLAHSLIREATSIKYRHYLLDKKSSLVVVSACNPDARFNKANAFARNKYIYCMANRAIVVSSNHEKGGTWAGAIEAVSKKWLPVLVKPPVMSGNYALVSKGAQWISNQSNPDQSIQDDTQPGQITAFHTEIHGSYDTSKENVRSNIPATRSDTSNPKKKGARKAKRKKPKPPNPMLFEAE